MKIDEKTYVDKAENVIQGLQPTEANRKGNMITTSKIRSLLAMVSDIYNEILNYQSDKLPEDIVGRIEYLRLRFAYEAGRDRNVKMFVDHAEILKILREIQGSKKNFILFCRYMEALVAFHKYYGGQD